MKTETAKETKIAEAQLQIRIKFLDESITGYQNKDEEYVEMMIRSATFEQWVVEDTPNTQKRTEISEFQTKVAMKTKLTLRLLHKEIDNISKRRKDCT